MAPFLKRPGVSRFRLVFRRCRMTIWSIIFLLVAAVAYMHLVGVPDMLKRPLLGRLLAKGIVAKFSNMQLGWFRGPSLHIEDAAFSQADQPLSPRLSARTADLALSWTAFRHGKIALRTLEVMGAQLRLPVSETNGDELALTNVSLDMRFRTNDVVDLVGFQGMFHGVQLNVTGEITNASGMRSWKLASGGAPSTTNAATQSRLRELADTLDKIQLSGLPVLRIETGADGDDINTFHAELYFAVADAVTPWGNFTNSVVEAACAHLSHPGRKPFLQVNCSTAEASMPQAKGRAVALSILASRGANSNVEAVVRLNSVRLDAAIDPTGTNWIGATRVVCNGTATLQASNYALVSAVGNLTASDMESPWGTLGETALNYHAARTAYSAQADSRWGPWTILAPWALGCEADVHDLQSPKLIVQHATFAAQWRGPELAVNNLKAELYGGGVTARATLNVASRELRADGVSDISPLSVSQLFARPVQEWLSQLEFRSIPHATPHVRVVLPPWTNRPPGWSHDVDASLELAGDFVAGDSSFQHIPVQKATGRVTYTNFVWHVSNIHTVRADGEADIDYMSSLEVFHYLVDSHMDPKVALPLVAPQQPHLLDDYTFTEPPEIHAEIWGHWGKDQRLGVAGVVKATNVLTRGLTISALSGRAEYTNLVLTVHEAAASNAQGHAEAPELTYNFATKIVTVTNGSGSVEPIVLQRLLDSPPDWLNSVRFETPPQVTVSGAFSLTNPLATDLRFSVAGKRLHYTNLLADTVAAQVNWTGSTVVLTNITNNLYNNGTLTGWIVFDAGTNFQTELTAHEIDLAPFIAQMTGQPTKVEGRLDGHLNMSGPVASSLFIRNGNGDVYVHDALLWDIKLFGLLSPVLNAIYPGWGHSRVRQALGTFVITNGVISSDDLELRSQGFVIHLRGKLDQHDQINARLEAVVSKEAPLIGPFLSFFFSPLSKIFEYHITGPVSNPVLEPVYIPKVVSVLLHPFHTLKTITAPDSTPKPAPPPP